MMITKELIEEKLLDRNGNPSRLKKKKHSDLCTVIREQFPHEDQNTSIWLAMGNEIRYCQKCNKALSISNFKIGYKDTQKWCSIECRDSDETYRKYFTDQLKKIDYQARTEKIRQTVFERYGVYHVNDVPEIRLKMNEGLNISKPQSREKYKQTCLEKYGSTSYFSSKEFRERMKCYESDVQKKIRRFIEELGFETKTDRTILKGKELDILVLGTNIAIEVNGIYWHSSWDIESDRKYKRRHLEKTLICKQNGVRLIHLTDVEIIKKEKIVESMLKSILHKSDLKIPARKCIVSKIESKVARSFLNSTHIQGWAPCSHFFGLFHNDELVSVMGFTKSRFDKSCDWELVRFSSKLNTTVVGGFTKLLKYFRRLHSGSIVSYADFSRSNGDVYLKNEFKEVGRSNPSYRWANINTSELINRHTMMKRNLPKIMGEKYDPNLTEAENLWSVGKYKRLWDCGQIKFVLK